MWEEWYCFGCMNEQPKMTKITGYNDGDEAMVGEIYLCEDFAKELYGENLDKPPIQYDTTGINVNVDRCSTMQFPGEDEDTSYTFKLYTNPYPEQVIPSRYFSDVYHFFGHDQFRPMWLRNDDLGHDLDIRIVGEDGTIKKKPDEEGEARKIDDDKHCYRPERLKKTGAKELVFSSFLAVSMAVYSLF